MWLLNIMLYAELNIDRMKGEFKSVNAGKIYHCITFCINTIYFGKI